MIVRRYFVDVYDSQRLALLHAGNKLTDLHINYRKKPMNVRLASQLFSKCVADSMQHLLDLNILQFEGCEGTIKFVRNINDLFDILNSTRFNTLFQFKKPISNQNFYEICDKLSSLYTYLKGLKVRNKKSQLISILKSKKKAGFLGFLISIQSVISIFIHNNEHLKYLATYKLSQDHLELEFSKYRSLCGSNNNPTAKQFLINVRNS